MVWPWFLSVNPCDCSEMELQRLPTQIHVDQFKAYESKPLNLLGRSVAVLSCVAYHFTPKIDDWRVRIAFSKKDLVLLVCHYKKPRRWALPAAKRSTDNKDILTALRIVTWNLKQVIEACQWFVGWRCIYHDSVWEDGFCSFCSWLFGVPGTKKKR